MDRAGRAAFGKQYLTGSFYLYHSCEAIDAFSLVHLSLAPVIPIQKWVMNGKGFSEG
jgi:hypothetical protein